jgi:hypothetical protein
VIGIPAMQDAFKLQMLDSAAWINVIALGLVPLVINELFKIILRMKRGKI